MLEDRFPIGHRIELPGHFAEPVVLESVRPLGGGYECRVRLADGAPDETILSQEEAAALLGQPVATTAGSAPAAAGPNPRLRLCGQRRVERPERGPSPQLALETNPGADSRAAAAARKHPAHVGRPFQPHHPVTTS